MPRSTTAKHRAASRPVTPLLTFGSTLTGPGGRRAVVAAASSGIVLTLTASASVAGPVDAARVPVPMANLTVASDDTITTSPTISVDADAKWSFDTSAADVSSEPPPPPPPPPPVVVQRPTYAETTSRTEERAPVAETVAAAPAPAATATGAAIVETARQYIGTPYVSGGASPGGFDCSGFTMYVFAQFGITLPRTSGDQRYAGTVVSAADARPGDLVWAPGHVGIYTGNGMHIAARNPGTPLYESEIYMSSPVFIRVAG